MRRATIAIAMLLGAAVSRTAFAQGAPSARSSCALTAHPGITAADAQVACRIACEQLGAVSLPGGHWFAVSMAPHDGSVLVCAEDRNVHGRVAGVHCAWAAGPKASAGWAARLAQDFRPGTSREAPLVLSARGDRLERKSWYGWQTLTVVGASLVPWAVAARGTSVPTGYLVAGTTGFFLGPPIVHLSRGNWGRAVGSLAMGTVPAMALWGVASKALSAQCSSESTYDRGSCDGPPAVAILAVFAALGHMIAYVAADSARLAWDYGPVRAAPSSALMPSLTLARSVATLGLGAWF